MIENKKFKKKILLCILLGITIGAIIKGFIFDFLTVHGTSMSPTIKEGENIIVNKTAYGIINPFSNNFLIQWNSPKNNDIVIFLHQNKIVVKRCVATEGTTLEFFKDPQYILKVNGKNIPLKEGEFEKLSSFSEVPKGYILALGDNLEQSIDSREYGFVSIKNITGKILGK